MSKKGIDVSYWQATVDWTQTNKDIDFVILREGYRKTIDKAFLYNAKQAKNVVGVYHFLYSLNVDEAVEEAKSCIANVKTAGLSANDIIVWCDFEYDTVSNAKKYNITLGKAECVTFTKAFCEYVESQGYKAGIYCNLDYYKNMYTAELLNKYPIWLADYTGGADEPCLYHQYSDKGTVAGISGNVDMNYYYGKEDTDMATDNTTTAIQAVIDIATAEIGYLEKKSNSQLDDKTANAGSNNYTKYWRDIAPSYQAQPWCAGFITWCFTKAFSATTTKTLLKHYPYVYCPTMSSLFTLQTTPKKGDIVIFKNNGTFTHTGLVVEVGANTFTTIEGNTSGASGIIANGGGVCKKSYTTKTYVNNGTRFCRPDYSIVTSSATIEATPTSSASTTNTTSTSRTPNKTPQWVGKVTASTLNVRTWAGTSNATIKSYPKLNKGNLVDVCDTVKASDGSSWYYIRIAGKYYGFVSAKYIAKV